MRIVLGVIVGLLVGFVCIWLVEMAGQLAFPPPADIDFNDPIAVGRMMGEAPVGALAFVAAAWFVGALAGAWTATVIAKRAIAGWIVAFLVLAACLTILVLLPGHPVWMWGAGILLPLIAGWLAQRLAKPAA